MIKPSLCTVLDPYVSKMTGIKQKDLDEANSFSEVSKAFSEFVKTFGIDSFFCWGRFDNKALVSSSKINNCDIMKNIMGTITNVQTMISSSIKYEGKVINKNISLDTVRKFYGIEGNGWHNSLNDAIIL